MPDTFCLRLTVSLVALIAAVPHAALAQSAAEPATNGQQAAAEAEGASAPEEIIVTGTRGLPRTVADSPTPIDVIGTAELEKTGRPGLLSSLNTLVPSFNVPTRAGGGTAIVSLGVV